MKNKIIVFGSLNLDFIVKTKNFPKIGETLMGIEYFIAPGGKGANQAVAVARLSCPVYMIGAVGNDYFGDLLIKNLKENHVKVDYVFRSSKKTGVAFININNQGLNSITVIPGANYELKDELLKKTFHLIKNNDIVIVQLEIPISSVYEIIKESKKRKAFLILNPSPIKRIKKEILKLVDILVLNEIEAINIVNKKMTQKEIALELVSLGVKRVIITLGKKGAIFCDKNKKIDIFPTLKVRSVDTTGAGDAFLGALAGSLLKGESFSKAIKIANIAGALSTKKYGAQNSFPFLKEMKKLRNI